MYIVKSIEGTHVSSIQYEVEINFDTIKESKKIFDEYTKEGKIIQGSFNDNIWILFDTRSAVKLEFNFSEILYKKASLSIDMCSYSQFIEIVKSYLIIISKQKTFVHLRNFLSLLKKVCNSTEFFQEDYFDNWLDDINVTEEGVSNYLIFGLPDFLDIIPIENAVLFKEHIEPNLEMLRRSSTWSGVDSRRELAEFQSLFLFDKIINIYWNSAKEDEKKFFYPVYLWWRITNILPLRPTEFVLTPRDCLRYDKDKKQHYLTVRRTKLKGASKNKLHKVNHDINLDYEKYEYLINEDLYNIINDYISISKPYIENKMDTLFSKNMLKQTASKLSSKSRFGGRNPVFSFQNLSYLLKAFYTVVIKNSLNYKVVYKSSKRYSSDKETVDTDEFLDPDTIMYISLGDTRHFAMINMVLNDFNPILIKDFAGHSDINTSYHYFGNTSKLVRCMTYLKYEELKAYKSQSSAINTESNYNANSILLELKYGKELDKSVDTDEGKCYSPKFIKGDIGDCNLVLGDCQICNYHAGNPKSSNTENEKRLKSTELALQKESEYLGYLITNYSKELSSDADIKQCILNIQKYANQYTSIYPKCNK